MYDIPITIVIDNEEYNIDIDVNFYKGEPTSYWEPGYPDEVEIIDITDNDFPEELQDISYNQVWGAIYDFKDEWYNELLKLVYKELEIEQDNAAEYLYEQQRDMDFWDNYQY